MVATVVRIRYSSVPGKVYGMEKLDAEINKHVGNEKVFTKGNV